MSEPPDVLPAASAPASAPDPAAAPAPTVVLLRATRAEAPGAVLKVAGLSIVERALRQLGRQADVRVVVADDGSIPLPARIPPNVQIQRVAADGADRLEALRIESGASVVTGADVVRRQGDGLAGGTRVDGEPARRRTEDALFADLLRGDLGFIARHVNKKISFRITRHVLCRLPVTPNQVTLGALLIGLCGCWLIASGTTAGAVGGLALMQLQSILDGCDGELARVRFQQTAIGEWLDTLVDDFLNLAIVASLGVGLTCGGGVGGGVGGGLGWIAGIGAAVTCGMFLFYNLVSYRELIRNGLGGELIKIRWKMTRGRDVKSVFSGTKSTATRLLLSLGRRDTFVFGWLLLAIVGLLPLALVWAAIVALACFGAAVAQVFGRDPAPAVPAPHAQPPG